MSNFVSVEYSKNPNTIKFLDKYVTFNPSHNALENAATRASILAIGQKDPILMLNGFCIDGRHRVKIAEEFDMQVKCIDVNPELNEQSLIKLCNINTTSGRDFNTAQKAIQALKLVTDFKFKIGDAAEAMKVNRKFVSLASTIRGYGRQDVLDALLAGKEVLLDGMTYPSKSIELLCKYIKTTTEKDTVIVDGSQRLEFNPDALVKTEMGKQWLYEKKIKYNLEDIKDIALIYDLIELANYKFRYKEEVGN